MAIPAQYAPPNHSTSCPYCRLRSAMKDRDEERELELDELGTQPPVMRVLKKIGRLVSRRS